MFNIHLSANLLRNLPVKKNCKSVKIWQNYGHESVAPFVWPTLYICKSASRHDQFLNQTKIPCRHALKTCLVLKDFISYYSNSSSTLHRRRHTYHSIVFARWRQYAHLYELLIHRNVTFLKNLQKFNSQHLVIGYLVRHSGKNELHELSDIL